MSEEKPRWTTKKRHQEMAAKARAGERLKIEATRTTQSDDTDISDVSLVLPRVDSDTEEQDDAIGETTFSQDDAIKHYKEWISCQPKETTKMIAILMMDVFRMRFRLTDVSAAKESSLMVGFNEKIIRIWRNEFYQCHGDFTESGIGKHSRPYVLDDENCRKKALSWLHDNAYQKDKPNLTAATFSVWVNTELLPNSLLPPGFPRSITPRTA